MPTTTPSVSNTNSWGRATFAGPLGRIVRQGLSDITGAIQSTDMEDFSSAERAEALGKSHIDRMKTTIAEGKNSAGGAIKQGLIGTIAGEFGLSANQLMALGAKDDAGNSLSFNPNVELLYEGPELRGFNFQYTFVPKSEAEAEEVARIIKHFKIHHSPEDTGNGMYKVPDIFKVRYMSGSDDNKFMPEFKRAALTNIQVQANPGLPMHMSFENGMPIVTSISLSFTEVDVITRKDHQDSVSYIGF
jgi:hypothetical protein